ncbi:hypothetical protein ACH5RR_007736 [Cinchona calisaya]|uniref:Fucosyltransferase n=1 Tax=Cinchona calisaya TaxID=153742 RepID=A0ABD3A9N9_9GENT
MMFWRKLSSQIKSGFAQKYTNLRGDSPEANWFCKSIKVIGIFVVCLLGFFVLLSALKDKPFFGLHSTLDDLKPSKKDVDFDDIIKHNKFLGEYFAQPPFELSQQDKLLGGLLPAGLDEESCISRYQSVMYRKEQKLQPSPYLVSRLRKYEALHKQCGPLTDSYKQTLEYLNSGSQQNYNSTGCKYVIWTPIHGLGNRILSLASTFLYALLTNRVLLVDPESKISHLFCEPFPEVSWLVPSDFPFIKNLSRFYSNSPQSYGNLKKNNNHSYLISSSLPPYVYVHLVHDYDDDDKQFFCDHDQTVLQNVPWLIMRSNIYFIPSLFSVSPFQQEINNLFPNLGTVFHFLGRYLFHPTNYVWGLVTTYYNTNLARADEKMGIQIRVLDKDSNRFKRVLDQILDCAGKENLLPQLINETKSIAIQSVKLNRTKAVLITSLTSDYFEEIKTMYWNHSTITGEVIQVYQPSHEENEQNENEMQNIKAWAEMYLLSLTDKLVTSGWSTFGYVAHSLGGLKPWILYLYEDYKAPGMSCQRAVSMEPCMHAPPYFDCTRKQYTGNTVKLIPQIQHCEDKLWGIKFIDRDDDL